MKLPPRLVKKLYNIAQLHCKKYHKNITVDELSEDAAIAKIRIVDEFGEIRDLVIPTKELFRR